MKKLFLLFFSLLVLGNLFQSCSDTKTYAEQLQEERDAIGKFLKANNITVISVDDFEVDTITRCEPDYPNENEYVLFPDGVYMQIVDRGEGRKPQNRDEITVRFLEYDIMEEYETGASNYNRDAYADPFYYTVSGTNVTGQFSDYNKSWLYKFYYSNNITDMTIPPGWLVPLRYVKDYSRVKLIVPSKMGHSYSSKYVYPFFYDIRKFQIY
ncbi:DUF4827 domain-containing protein [Bacteroides sp. OttesenSCG-928-J23]|nr:DUF4827 domain-containing protein [Bacteroides sp. OttesenSCG-928-J23]